MNKVDALHFVTPICLQNFFFLTSNNTNNIMYRISAFLSLLLFLTHMGFSQTPSTLFKSMSSRETNIRFKNTVTERPGQNILEAEYFYNGAGVSIGDINNDGLPDIYLTANKGLNALYLNQGNLHFKNVTKQAGVADSSGWSSGVVMGDVNGDGLLDIYVCKTGHGNKNNRRNKLFINNGDLTFTNRAKKYGLDDPGYTTNAVFFDYDHDSDLDVYLVNYSVKQYQHFNIVSIRKRKDPFAGDKLLRNDNGHFTDVSDKAGIIQNPIGFGLSATASDINMDGWPDLYVTNDYMEKDYLYINQHDGTFREEIAKRTTQIPYFSMGTDIADFNNDTYPDILTVDMLPDQYQRRRMVKKPKYKFSSQLVANGYHRQIMRNMLQRNNGDGSFTEMGQLVGIDKTDWSWAPLLADFDNDGLKDIYITNGFPRDYTNRDYLNNIFFKQFPDGKLSRDPDLLFKMVKKMPRVRLRNHSYKNMGNLQFRNSGKKWGLNQYAVSSGAAYGDLDNDGDLDLVVNNLNKRAFLYKNQARERNSNNYLKLKLKGTGQNTFGLGAKIIVTTDSGEQYFQEAYPVRGYQSSVEPVWLFGLGSHKKVDLQVTWNDHSKQSVHNITVNQTITLNQNQAPSPVDSLSQKKTTNKVFLLLDKKKMGLETNHTANSTNDISRSSLLHNPIPQTGPALATADVNKDGLVDLYLGGSKGQPGRLLLQQKNGTFTQAKEPFFEMHKKYRDTDALFFDANGDGNTDLYVVSGGASDPPNSSVYQDRLYLNDGFGNFSYQPDAIPNIRSSSSTVAASDFDHDGDTDLFVGGRIRPGTYPLPPRSYLLENDHGQFKDITKNAASALVQPGLVSDAVWTDIDHDHNPDLILTGEWMPIRIFHNNADKTFTEITEQAGLQNTTGWWNIIRAADLNGDGNTDLIAGNRGLNTSLHVSSNKPIILFANDFDNNGYTDHIMTQMINNNRYPVPGRDKLVQQIPQLKSKFPDYSTYAKATINDILTDRQQKKASRFSADTFASSVFINNGNGTFRSVPLPREAQIFPIFSMLVADFNGDHILDLLLSGNNFENAPQTGPVAGLGTLLLGNKSGNYKVRRAKQTGFRATGDIRKMKLIPSPLGYIILVGRNGNNPIPYLYQRPEK